MSTLRTLQVSTHSTQEMAGQGDPAASSQEDVRLASPEVWSPLAKCHHPDSSSLAPGISMMGARANPCDHVVPWVYSGCMGQTPLLTLV